MTTNAKLAWIDGQPFSEAFGDVYFSRDSGLEETRHVFLENNQLPRRFAALAPHQAFAIGETGFGTGLNFLCAWQCFRRHAHPEARLNFVSVEKFPLSKQDLMAALALWPQLAEEAGQLCRRYCDLPSGWHRFIFEEGRVTLTLIVGDALETLPLLDGQIDAWFLDGFSPAKNPDMWTETLFQAMAMHSAPGATLATFTCAGFVRRGLKAAGFDVEKVPGFGMKREMTRGVLAAEPPERPWLAPWFARPPATPARARRAIVIGGGISGASSAYSLAIRGWQVTLIERHSDLAVEASGNSQGILYARLSAHNTPQTQLVLSGYLYTLGLLRQHFPDGAPDWDACGVLQLPVEPEDRTRQQALIDSGLAGPLVEQLDAAAASRQAGVPLDQGGLYFPQGGWLRPASLVHALSAHPGIQVMTGNAVLELDYNPEHHHWLALGAQGPLAIGDVVILATAADTACFDCTSHLPLKRIRGQTSHVPATPASRTLQTVICHEGYVTPALNDQHCVGASFTFNLDHLALLADEHRSNLDNLQHAAPWLHQALAADTLDCAHLDGRAAYRCTTPDYLPLVGPVVTQKHFVESYRSLAQDASLQLTQGAPWVPGLYINTAHGSRGFVTAPLAGEILAAQINGEPSPLPKPLQDALHPNRFLLRNLIRGKLDSAE